MGRAVAAVDDRPDPTLDASRTPRKYAALARDFRDSAWEHLGKNDLPQASDKAWGLVAETIKDIGAQHGAIIHTHRAIVAVVTELRRLVANTGDMATARWISATFATARELRTNFYEDELTQEIVMDSLIQCEEPAELLRRRLVAVV